MRIAIVGCGTLGSRVSDHLRGRDVLHVDHDVVSEENLPHQAFTSTDVGARKASVLAERNGGSCVDRFIDERSARLLDDVDIIIDCTDNLRSRRVLDEHCARRGITLIHGAVGPSHGIAVRVHGSTRLADIYAGKTATATCRSRDINIPVADAVARLQARMACESDTDATAYLVQEEETIPLSIFSRGATWPASNHEVLWCTRRDCLSTLPLRPLRTRPRTVTHEGITCEISSDGQVHYDTRDVEAIKTLATMLHALLDADA